MLHPPDLHYTDYPPNMFFYPLAQKRFASFHIPFLSLRDIIRPLLKAAVFPYYQIETGITGVVQQETPGVKYHYPPSHNCSWHLL